MTNTKSNSHKDKDQQHSGPSKQDKHSSPDKKQTEKQSSSRASSTGAGDDDPEKDLEVTDDPEGTKKKIPHMNKK
jgi:hypothetical protein